MSDGKWAPSAADAELWRAADDADQGYSPEQIAATAQICAWCAGLALLASVAGLVWMVVR